MCLLGLSGCHAAQDGDTIDNSTVSVFDIRRFMGKWYEIARYDHRFEKGMTHVAATYSLQENGSIKVKMRDIKWKTQGGRGACQTAESCRSR